MGIEGSYGPRRGEVIRVDRGCSYWMAGKSNAGALERSAFSGGASAVAARGRLRVRCCNTPTCDWVSDGQQHASCAATPSRPARSPVALSCAGATLTPGIVGAAALPKTCTWNGRRGAMATDVEQGGADARARRRRARDAAARIEHVIVLMLENVGFDHMLGLGGAGSNGLLDSDGRIAPCTRMSRRSAAGCWSLPPPPARSMSYPSSRSTSAATAAPGHSFPDATEQL